MELKYEFVVDNFENYIIHEVNEKIKYLNLFVLLAFLVGQVQYAYTFYFCTMKQMPVSAPSMATTSVADDADGICDECQGVIAQPHGLQLVEGNCVKVVTTEKSVVSNFTELAKFNSHIVTVFNFIQADGYAQQISRQSFILVFQANSPPLDIPTLNSNLRI